MSAGGTLRRRRLFPPPARLRLPRPRGMPENFAFNTGHNHLFRRLISTFISPLGAAYMFVVALLAAPMRRLAVPFAALVFAGLLFTISRSALTGLVAGLLVLALARREWWPLAAVAVVTAAGIGFDRAYTHVAPTTHFLPGRAEGAGGERETAPRREDKALRLQRAVVAEPPVQPAARAEHGRAPPTGLRPRQRRRDGGALRRRPQGRRVELHGDRRRDRPPRDDRLRRVEPRAPRRTRAPRLDRTPGALRDGAAGIAAALAAILLIAVQTDAFGIPWLGLRALVARAAR